MAIDVALRHRTAYRYDRLVQLGPQLIRLRPAPHCRTRVLSYSLTVTPKLHFLNWQQDPQGNYQARLVFPERTREFAIDVDLVAEMAVFNPFDFFLEPDAETFPFAYAPWLDKELAAYLVPLPAGPLLAEWLASVPRQEARTVDFLVALNARLQQEIGYVIRLEPGIQTCEETLGSGRGSCRDTGLAAGADPAPPGHRRPLRLRLPDPAQARRQAAGRPGRRRPGLHRSARLDRGLPAGRRLDRLRSDVRDAGRRRPSAARLHARSGDRGADQRQRRRRQTSSSTSR